MRYMYDAISANASKLVAQNPNMVAIYLTGSPDIRWLSPEVLLFPHVTTWVRIDQGGFTSPQYEATVFDAEPGAYTLSGAIAATKKCTAPRPTVYCDRDYYKDMPNNYTGDIWLAAPGLSDSEAEALAEKDRRIVAVQNVWNAAWDRSVVIDPYWPEKAPVIQPATALTAAPYAMTAACAVTWKSSRPAPYKLEYQRLEGAQGSQHWVSIDTVTMAGSSTTIANLAHNTSYRYRIYNGVWSAWEQFKTP